jgi:hypothetical protein
MAKIAIWALVANLILAIIAYIADFELFTRLSIYFIAWQVIPISNFDGAKILYASKARWIIAFTIAMIILGWSLIVI